MTSQVKFNVFKLTKEPFIMNSCCKIDATRKCLKETFKIKFPKDTLACLVHNSSINHKDLEIMTYAQYLEETKLVGFASQHKHEDIQQKIVQSNTNASQQLVEDTSQV